MACIVLISGTSLPDQKLRLPSGASAIPLDLIVEEGVQRVRMIGQGLAQDVAGYQTNPTRLFADMHDICMRHIAATPVVEGSLVIITLMDRETPFGVADPSVTQYFEAFTIRGGACELDDAEFLD